MVDEAISFWAQVMADQDRHSAQDVYHAYTRSTHEMGSLVRILDQDEKPLGEFTDVVDGGVSWDLSTDPDRSLDVTVLDPRGRLVSGSPNDESADAHKFVQAIYEMQHRDGWLRFPLFTGPLSSGNMKRQGAQVQITATGKESLYLDPYTSWKAQHYAKGKKVTDAIKELAAVGGETRFRFDDRPDTLPDKRVIKPFTATWPIMKSLAAKMGERLYYDGEGFLALQPLNPKKVAYVFDGDQVLTTPEDTDDFTTIINAAETTGGDPKGSQKPLHIRVQLPPHNPFSPDRMARHDINRRAIATDSINKKLKADLVDHAKTLLKGATKTISFDCLPVPHLRPGMFCRVVGEYDGQRVDINFILRSGFMPLTAMQPMTIGSWTPLAGNWRAGRHRHHHNGRGN